MQGERGRERNEFLRYPWGLATNFCFIRQVEKKNMPTLSELNLKVVGNPDGQISSL